MGAAVEAVVEEDGLLLAERIRKTTAAATGGALVALGVFLLPIPIPVSIPLMGSGLHVLGQEFDAAKDAEEKLMESVETARIAVMEKVDAAKKQLDELKQSNPAVTGENNGGVSPSLTSPSP